MPQTYIVGEFARSSADMSEKLSRSTEIALQKHDKSLVSTLTDHIGKCILKMLVQK